MARFIEEWNHLDLTPIPLAAVGAVGPWIKVPAHVIGMVHTILSNTAGASGTIVCDYNNDETQAAPCIPVVWTSQMHTAQNTGDGFAPMTCTCWIRVRVTALIGAGANFVADVRWK